MANYKHGVYISETGTSLIPTVRADSAIPFVVGAAPVNMVADAPVNVPVLINGYADAVKAFGFAAARDIGGGKKAYEYSLSEFTAVNFELYGVVPCVYVNVLDPKKHVADMVSRAVDLADGVGTIAETGVLPDTLTLLRNADADDPQSETVSLIQGTDYTVTFDDEGLAVITVLDRAKCPDGRVSITAGKKLDPSKLTAADIIGGIDAGTGKTRGLECLTDVYPKFRIVPTLLLAPQMSGLPEVAACLSAKAALINGHFKATALIDVPADVTDYGAVPAWKNDHGVTQANEIVCYPRAAVGDTVTCLSCHAVGVMGVTDAGRDGVPYVSPSNKAGGFTGLCDARGGEIVLDNEKANYLNGQGVMTALNFTGGWRLWGNRTAVYPAVTDPKDAFIPVRRMFDWVGNTIVQTVWQRVDEPGNRRLIDTVVNSLNVWLHSLTARQQLLGGEVQFREEDNPTTDLMDGIYRFKVFMTPPSPAERIEFNLEINVADYAALYA